MPGPSDIRVNPFNNATNYVNLTERHIVPSVSPFVVRLNEVPENKTRPICRCIMWMILPGRQRKQR